MTILANQRKILVDYLLLKVEQQDWHGVADAAMDLRELDVREEIVPEKITVGQYYDLKNP